MKSGDTLNIDNLYSPEEIGQKLKISKYTVYEMIKRGELNAHQVGRHIRVSDSQLKVYLANSKGAQNVFAGRVVNQNDEIFVDVGNVLIRVNTMLIGEVKISINPDDIILSKQSVICSARNIHKGKVIDIKEDDMNMRITLDIGVSLEAGITKTSYKEMDIKINDELFAIFKALSVKAFK